eukprot:15444383-Alexandrium_andersonii.AAC.1
MCPSGPPISSPQGHSIRFGHWASTSFSRSRFRCFVLGQESASKPCRAQCPRLACSGCASGPALPLDGS